MRLVSLTLACAAAAVLVAFTASAFLALTHRLARPVTARLRPSARADIALVAGVLPAAAAVATIVGALTPSIASLLGAGPDHCPAHTHHLHLCIRHAAGLPLSLLVMGALAVAAFAVRAIILATTLIRTRSRLAALERLGECTSDPYPVIAVPSPVPLCHATGTFRPRIIVSQELAAALPSAQRTAAFAHEAAHLRRRDPLASIVLAAAGLFAPPSIAECFQRAQREAAEEACDAAAARAVGGGRIVAEALLNAAQFCASIRAPQACPAFAEVALERRIRLLLRAADARIADPHWLAACPAFVGSLLLLAYAFAPAVHHALETGLDLLF